MRDGGEHQVTLAVSVIMSCTSVSLGKTRENRVKISGEIYSALGTLMSSGML